MKAGKTPTKTPRVGKKRTRRSDSLYPALDPKLNLATRREEITDLASYANKLSPEDRAWLNAFAEEEIVANFNHSGIKLNTTVEEKRRIYNKNNARNRCIHTQEMAQGKLTLLDDMKKIEPGQELELDEELEEKEIE